MLTALAVGRLHVSLIVGGGGENFLKKLDKINSDDLLLPSRLENALVRPVDRDLPPVLHNRTYVIVRRFKHGKHNPTCAISRKAGHRP